MKLNRIFFFLLIISDRSVVFAENPSIIGEFEVALRLATFLVVITRLVETTDVRGEICTFVTHSD